MRAIVTAATESLRTFTEVRNISRKRSTAKINPIPSNGKPNVDKTIVIIIKPAIGIAAAPSMPTKQ